MATDHERKPSSETCSGARRHSREDLTAGSEHWIEDIQRSDILNERRRMPLALPDCSNDAKISGCTGGRAEQQTRSCQAHGLPACDIARSMYTGGRQ